MNIKSMKNNIANTALQFAYKAKATGMKHSPEIFLTIGIVGVFVSTVMACKATIEAIEVKKEFKDNLDAIHDVANSPEKPENYTEETRQKDTVITYSKCIVKMAKLYGPSVLVGGVSIASILMGHKILRKRNAALLAAYTALDKSFKGYRKRVVEQFGEEVDKQLKYNIKAKEIEETATDKNGTEITRKKTIETPSGDIFEISPYARFFDESSDQWEKDAEANLFFLKMKQNYFNDRLRARGYVFLNEVYDELGLLPSKAGQIVGWTRGYGNTESDGYIDFGIYDLYDQNKRDFVNGYERSILLDFNVDGPIIDYI